MKSAVSLTCAVSINPEYRRLVRGDCNQRHNMDEAL
ncbi:Uncharacterised protein [Vibrio cholerae]|nr:Uncharacterised protein [Vibrio cholerae]